jgi:hypothetical protein
VLARYGLAPLDGGPNVFERLALANPLFRGRLEESAAGYGFALRTDVAPAPSDASDWLVALARPLADANVDRILGVAQEFHIRVYGSGSSLGDEVWRSAKVSVFFSSMMMATAFMVGDSGWSSVGELVTIMAFFTIFCTVCNIAADFLSVRATRLLLARARTNRRVGLCAVVDVGLLYLLAPLPLVLFAIPFLLAKRASVPEVYSTLYEISVWPAMGPNWGPSTFLLVSGALPTGLVLLSFAMAAIARPGDGAAFRWLAATIAGRPFHKSE